MSGEEDEKFDIAQIESDLWKAEQVNRARERVRQRARKAEGKDNVVACRLDNETLAAVDTLVEAGVRANRADAAAWLIGVGLEAHRDLLEDIADTVTEIRRLREDAAGKARRHASKKAQ
ncbi:MAG TPA: hypothetical protein VHX59_00725 [Mycobacteriales bacterium]|jgi:hypothetical protein|nr:hypothetical protein [Mycobacteriales bacterium]